MVNICYGMHSTVIMSCTYHRTSVCVCRGEGDRTIDKQKSEKYHLFIYLLVNAISIISYKLLSCFLEMQIHSYTYDRRVELLNVGVFNIFKLNNCIMIN